MDWFSEVGWDLTRHVAMRGIRNEYKSIGGKPRFKISLVLHCKWILEKFGDNIWTGFYKFE
jgi:hypothetical protein